MESKKNLEDDQVEPVTDLGLSLNYSGQNNQREALNIDPSAGANAGSGVHMTFVTTNPLTELVWSPHKGLSLKCADCSFSDWKPALLWGAGPSNTSETKCFIEPLSEPSLMELKKIDDVKLGFSPIHESSDKENTGNSENMPEIKMKAPADIGGLRDGQKGSISGLVDLKMAEASKRKENTLSASPGCGDGGMTVDFPTTQHPSSNLSSIRKHGTEMVPASEVHPVDKHKLSDAPLLSAAKEKGKRMEMSPCVRPHLEKLESTFQDDLQASNIGNIGEAGSKSLLKTESAPAIKMDLMLDCDVNPGENIIYNSHSPPSNRKVHKHESKGKGKALSEGDVSGRFSKDEEEDDSYESVESCNSARISTAGKRRWSFERHLIVGSKRAKQIEQIPGTSSSLIKHDSSFMNWILNMTRGFARPLNQDDEASPLGLVLSKPNHVVHENLDAPVDGDIRPLNSRSMGFKSIFQSMYCSNKSSEGMTTGFNQLGEGSAEIELPIQPGSSGASLLASLHKESDVKVTKENLNEVSLGNEGAPLGTPKIPFGNFITFQAIDSACSSGSGNSNDLDDGKGKDATKTSDSSLNGDSARKGQADHSPPLQEKRANDFGHKGDPLGSPWITHFSGKSPCSFIKQEVGNPSTRGPCESAQNLLSICRDRGESTDQESSHIMGDRELKKFGFTAEPSVGFRRIEDPALKPKVNQKLPSSRLKSSEAMASVFARTLDALKNIIQSSDLLDDSSRATATCFFCGKKGHRLQNCSEITEPELEDLLRNIKSYDNAKGSPCLCIRCFQLNHWAVMCPNTVQKNPKDNPKCNLKLKHVFTGDGILSSANELVKKSNEHGIAPLGTLEKWQVSQVPKGIFSAIQALRLSRTDISKWMNSRIPLSQLDGFFLRLRLGKWGEGLGGTGYHVACITGMQKKSLVKNARCPISVNVRGIKCLVESQYISNHDFLEDELMAWWCTASRSGGKIPSEEDLKTKVEEKKMLGF